MSNKKRIQKKIQSIESKRWFREVSFIINEGFPELSIKAKAVGKAFSDFATAAKVELIKIVDQFDTNAVKMQGSSSIEKFTREYEPLSWEDLRRDFIPRRPVAHSFNLSSSPAESNKTLN